MTDLRSANLANLGTPLRVGVDIGGSKVAVLVADPSGNVVGRELAPSVPADPEIGRAHV